jgi:hypothetical protein
MSIQDWYQAYEDAFEQTFVDDDWSQTLVFDGKLISRFRGVWDPGARTAMNERMTTYGSVLQQD